MIAGAAVYWAAPVPIWMKLMKVVILAGGLGTRLSEETEVKPKPMVEIGGRPILWHIMKYYAQSGFHEFALALGYKGEVIKRYFLEYYELNGSFSVNLSDGAIRMRDRHPENWLVHLMDTGTATNTGGRLKALQPVLGDETFMLTYGDGLCSVDLKALLEFHKKQGRIATITAVRPPARFGGLILDGSKVSEFTEKPQTGEGWINGGFMVLEPAIFQYIKGPSTILEADVLEVLARQGQLSAFQHPSFWQCMDTKRDLQTLESHWRGGKAPWRVWP